MEQTFHSMRKLAPKDPEGMKLIRYQKSFFLSKWVFEYGNKNEGNYCIRSETVFNATF